MVENKFKADRYGGIEIKDMSLLPDTEESFRDSLKLWIEEWPGQGVRSVQIFFKPPKCHLMNAAFENGFYFHHANQKEAYVLMILWLDKKVPCRVPHYAHHYIGVGGVVISESEQILLIKENRSLDDRKWKLPGGYVDCFEKIYNAVEREVKEETGVTANFLGIVGLRE